MKSKTVKKLYVTFTDASDFIPKEKMIKGPKQKQKQNKNPQISTKTKKENQTQTFLNTISD